MGEQGFVSMYPLLMVDKGMTLGRIGVTAGIFGQLCSIAGSSLGGILISRFRYSVSYIFTNIFWWISESVTFDLANSEDRVFLLCKKLRGCANIESSVNKQIL